MLLGVRSVGVLRNIVQGFGTAASTQTDPTMSTPVSASSSTLRVTEQPNPRSHDIDVAATVDAVRMLQHCDEQLFEDVGFEGLPVRRACVV